MDHATSFMTRLRRHTPQGRNDSPSPQRVSRIKRWDVPFAAERLPTELIDYVLANPAMAGIDPADFPPELALNDLIANDTRPIQLNRGDVIYRAGEFGTSLYLVLYGVVKELRAPAPSRRSTTMNRLAKSVGFGLAPSQLSTRSPGAEGVRTCECGVMFGIAEAMNRGPRRSTMVADDDNTVVLEIRWAGARELRHLSSAFRAVTDRQHSHDAVWQALSNCTALEHLSDRTLIELFPQARFEWFGSYEWGHSYLRAIDQSGMGQLLDHEPQVVAHGDYLDEIIIVESGLLRVTQNRGAGQQTVGYLNAGDCVGLPAPFGDPKFSRAETDPQSFKYGLSAIGYAGLVRLPTVVLDQVLQPKQARPASRKVRDNQKSLDFEHQSRVDFSVDHRFVNGTQAMAIDMDRCVNCDECVRACADTHDGVARFVRTGPSHANIMITHACMHCQDPVCLIGCPTGAIDRRPDTGDVTIDESQCIGCTICANSCPYGNIRMEPAHTPTNRPIVDESGQAVLKAIKCDLCYGQKNGPACHRACPHDALTRVDIGSAAYLGSRRKR